MFLGKPLSSYQAPIAGCSTLLAHRSAWRTRTARESLPSFLIQTSCASLRRHLITTQKAAPYRSTAHTVLPAHLPQGTQLPCPWMLQGCSSHPEMKWAAFSSPKCTGTHSMPAPNEAFGDFLTRSQNPLQCGWRKGEMFHFRITLCYQDNMVPMANTHLFLRMHICEKPSLGNFF